MYIDEQIRVSITNNLINNSINRQITEREFFIILSFVSSSYESQKFVDLFVNHQMSHPILCTIFNPKILQGMDSKFTIQSMQYNEYSQRTFVEIFFKFLELENSFLNDNDDMINQLMEIMIHYLVPNLRIYDDVLRMNLPKANRHYKRFLMEIKLKHDNK